MSLIKVNAIQTAGGLNGLTLNANGRVDVANTIGFPDGTVMGSSSGSTMKNRLINGDFRIDQRGLGSVSVTASTNSSAYIVDRWRASWGPGAGVMSWTKIADAPPGFLNSLKGTVTTASTPGSGDNYTIVQPIEGLNLIDMNLGTAYASSFTMSFWVKSSVAGLFSVAARATSGASSCVRQFTINAINTWEYKTVTFPAPTSGTFATDTGAGLFINFVLGAGSSYFGTDGVWTSGALSQNSTSTNLIATNGATFQFTGVQVEKGSTATSFDFRQYGQELFMCQRYCAIYGGLWNIPSGSYLTVKLPTVMRGTMSFPSTVAAYGQSYVPTIVSGSTALDGVLVTPNASTPTIVGFYGTATAEL